MKLYSASLTCLLTLLWSAPTGAHDAGPDPTRLSIMTYNTEFLWDGKYPEDGKVTFAWRGNPLRAMARIKAVASVIEAANPDIVILVEIENAEVLTSLSSLLSGYKPYFVQGTDTYTGQDIGMLSKVTPLHVGRSMSAGAVSKHLVARFSIHARCLSLIGVHFLARRIPARTAQRERQARAIQAATVTELNAHCTPIVLGDMNDYDGDVLDQQNSRPLSRVLFLLRHPKTGLALNNAAETIVPSERYTAWWDKNHDHTMTRDELTSLDHILFDSRLAASLVKASILHNTPQSLSDHWPVFLEINLNTPTYKALP